MTTGNDAGATDTHLVTVEDVVNRPGHYTQGSVECIEAIESALGGTAFVAYCKGNVIKYLWRYERKGGVQDLRKAKWYLEKMIDRLS